MLTLSKSRYCKGVQCPKILWMDVNMPGEFDKSVMNDSLLAAGSRAGDLAMGYFGEFSEIPFTGNKLEMAGETRRLLDAGTCVIAEASFSFDGCFCMSDILRKVEGGYELVEVKASAASEGDGPETVKHIYLDDMAFQYHVTSNCGLDVKKVSIMRLNRDYIRQGEIDIQKLFVLTDCTETVLAKQEGIAGRIAKIKAAAVQKEEPHAVIGSRCDDPYTCGYKKWCFQNLPDNNVFDIGFKMRKDRKDAVYLSGFISFEEVFNGQLRLNDQQLLQLITVIHNLPPHIEPDNIRRFLNGLSYPLCHLDFETVQQPVPLWDGVKPYQQIPFQYSLHIQDKPCSEPAHREFLAIEGKDPRRELAEQLCADIPPDACVLAYSAGFEKGRIRELAETFPDLSQRLMSIHSGVADLAAPFSKGFYYCREMCGSYSIKSVLPALFPNNPELDYKSLGLIHNGGEAMDAYATLHEKPPGEIAEIRVALLAYCKLDTLAMVKILGKLYELI